MDSIIKKIFEGKVDEETKQPFLRYGRGNYKRRFLLSLQKSKKIKVRGSFEWANDFVNFANDNKDIEFSGKIMMRDKVAGKVGRKKAGSFVYEVSGSKLEEFENAYCYLLNANSDDLVLKIKKSLPKLGKAEDKIDDKFCSLDIEEKYWAKLKETFFWDLPENFKKVLIEHEIVIDDIVFPENEKDPEKIRELAKRKGKLIRKVSIDGKEDTKEKPFVL